MNQSHKYFFAFKANGRAVIVICSDGENSLTLHGEMAGVKHLDILLSPVDLRCWSDGQVIDKEEQLILLKELSAWLHAQKIRSDIDSPYIKTHGTNKCFCFDCKEPAIEGIAFCMNHFDNNLLMK